MRDELIFLYNQELDRIHKKLEKWSESKAVWMSERAIILNKIFQLQEENNDGLRILNMEKLQ